MWVVSMSCLQTVLWLLNYLNLRYKNAQTKKKCQLALPATPKKL